jgi:hypothetical protein
VRALTPSERQVLANSGASDEHLQQEFAIAAPEGNGASLAEQLLKPAINVRGIRAGYVGERVNNTISSEAIAMIGFRLVPNQTEEKVRPGGGGTYCKAGILYRSSDSGYNNSKGALSRGETGLEI